MTKDEFVNSYLDNELTDIERLDFESKLPHDPELSEEYNFQKELIDGINNVRRLELKSRLSNILISTPLYQTIGFKAIAIASVSVGIGFGAYYLFDVDNEPELATIDLKRNQITLSEEKTTPEIPKAILPVIDEDESDKIEPEPKKEESDTFFGLTDQSHLSIQRTVYTRNPEPKADQHHTLHQKDEEIEKNSQVRSQRLREMSMFKKDQQELEDTPAYVRRNVDLDDSIPSVDSEISRYTLGTDSKDNPDIRPDNQFLHDNVD